MGVVNAVVDTVGSVIDTVISHPLETAAIVATGGALAPEILAGEVAGTVGLESLAAAGVDTAALSSAVPAISGEVAAAASGLGAAGATAGTAGLAGAIGDMAVDFPLTGGFGTATAPGVKEAVGQMMSAGGTAATSAGLGLSDIVGGAKTAGQIIGGLGQIAGGAKSLGGTGVSPQQADPFAQYRSGYAAQLANLLKDPSTVTQTPGYQFNLAQGLQAMQAQQASQGRLVSGGGLIQAQQFGQNLAQQTYQQQLATLSGLSGATQAPAAGATSAANIATANLGGTLGGWQSIAGGLGQVANPLMTLYANYNTATPTA